MKNKSAVLFFCFCFCFLAEGVFFFAGASFFSPSRADAQETLSLQEGLRLVTANNRSVRIALKQQDVAMADTLIARSPMLPTVNGSAGETLLAMQPKAIFDGITVPESEKDFYSYSLTVQQVLWDFEGNASRYGASKAILAASRFDTMRIRNFAALQFTFAYYDLLESQKMVQVAKDELARLQSHLKDAANLYNQGVITKNDLLQAQVRISDASQRLVSARNARDIMAARINDMLARPLETQFRPVDVPAGKVYYSGREGGEISPKDLSLAWQMAEEKRPEIAIVNETMRSLDLDRKAANSEYYPKFFAQGGYDYTKNHFVTPNGNWSLVLGLGINLYGGGITRAEIDKIDSQKEKLFEQKDKLTSDIRLEVETYSLDLQNALRRIEATKDAVRQATENLRINRIRYEEGEGTATDVLDALTLLTVAETNDYRAEYDFRKAEAGFLYSQGNDLAEVYK